jgi:hypothetical protein
MKKLKRFGIGLGLILVGMSGTVQAQSIYTTSLYDNSFSRLQIKWHDQIECQISNSCHVPPPPPPRPSHTGSKRSDFDGDGTADILWSGGERGAVYIWFMNGATYRGALIATGIVGFWEIVDVGDFDGDGTADILWRSKMGDVAIWFMNGATYRGVVIATGISWLWDIVGVRDLNGDGKADLLWRSRCGPGAIMFMNGANIISGAAIKNVSLQWSIVPGRNVHPADPSACSSG